LQALTRPLSESAPAHWRIQVGQECFLVAENFLKKCLTLNQGPFFDYFVIEKTFQTYELKKQKA